jgi:hypothetical protein
MDRWPSRVLGDAYYNCIARGAGVFHKDCEQFTRTTSCLQHRLGERPRRRRMVLEQRHMRRHVFRAPKSWPVRPGQIERGDPQRIGDGPHEHVAIARKPDQPARVERLLRALDSRSWEYYFKRSKSLPPPNRASATIMICVRYRSKNSLTNAMSLRHKATNGIDRTSTDNMATMTNAVMRKT